ncbi:MAG: hypothetical protein DCC58_02345 [Chloroflexi bacterium]|nr:MAG: hypothetical protein DCC58_02345 [Chloroflexota bacterium]
MTPEHAGQAETQTSAEQREPIGRELTVLDTLFENMPLGIAIYDRGFVLQRFNPTWSEILRRASRSTQVVQPGMHVLDIESPQERRAAIINRLKSGESVRRPAVHYRTPEGDMWIDVSQSPLWTDGVVTGFIEVVDDVTERVLAEEALRERLRFDDLVTTISTRFVNLPAGEIDAGIESALGAIGAFAGVDRSYVFQFNDDLTTMSYTHEWCAPGIAPVQDRLQDFPLANVAWSTGHMLRQEVLHIPRVADIPEEGQADRAELEAQEVRSLLLVPMVYLGKPVGFLGFDAVREEKSWSDESIRLLTIVGEIFVNALQRKRAEEVLREREMQYRSIFEATSDGLIVTDARTGLIVDANPAVSAMHGYQHGELLGQHWTVITPPEYWEQRVAARSQAQEQGRFHVQSHGLRKDGQRFAIDARGTAFTYRGAPAVLGVVRDITEQVQAMDLLEARVEERTREIATLLEVSRKVNATLDLRDLFEMIFDQLKYVLPDYGGSAILLLDNADELVIVASRTEHNPEVAAREIGIRYPLSASSRLISEQLPYGPVTIADVRSDHPLAHAFREVVGERIDTDMVHVRSWMSAPLIVRERTIGLLTISANVPGYFDARRMELVTAIANQAAVAIDNARLLEQAQGRAALEERQRLARELHDSVSQALYGIALGARTARTLLERDPARVGEPLEYVLSLAEAGLAEMRALIFELRPESLAQEGLVAALEKHAASLRARHRLDVVAQLGSEPPASLAVKEALYRIAQESLHNTVKHARARSVHLRLQYDSQRVALEISDDGDGFVVRDEFPGHLGLESMRERVARLNGDITITSAPGSGASVRVNLPLQR